MYMYIANYYSSLVQGFESLSCRPLVDWKWAGSGPEVDQKWTKSGPEVDQKWTRSGPEVDQKGSCALRFFKQLKNQNVCILQSSKITYHINSIFHVPKIDHSAALYIPYVL